MKIQNMKIGQRLTAVLVAGLASVTGAGAAVALEGQTLVDGYQACWAHFNQRQWDQFRTCYGDKAVSVSPGLPPARGGKQIVEQHALPFVVAMPDVKGELQLVIASGKRIASVALIRGTHTGPLAGPDGAIPPTGKKIGMLVGHAVESAGAQAAAREWHMQDGGTLMAQLGLSPLPARPAITKGAATPTVVVASGSAVEKANLTAARKLYAAFNARDKQLGNLLDEQAVERNQSVAQDVVGKEAVAAFIGGFWQMSSDVKLRAPVLWAAGEYVVAIGAFSGTNDGEMPALGLPRTGKRFKVDVLEISRWKNGKLVELWPFYNGAQLAQQLGLTPPTPATAKR